MSNSVLTRNTYGKIHLKLNEIMDERKITRYRLSQDTDTLFSVIDRWYKDNVEKLDLDMLASICYVLDCEVSDLLVYEKTEE